MDLINHSTTKKTERKICQKKDIVSQDNKSVLLKRTKRKRQFPRSKSPDTSTLNIENNNNLDKLVFDKIDLSTVNTNYLKSSLSISSKEKLKTIYKIKDQKSQIVITDDSENSSEEKASFRKDRKPLPLLFNQSRSSYSDNNDSSSEASEDTKETNSYKCEYLGERETLRSFWDKCLYQCFQAKRCVAGEKPKRKYRKKPKAPKPSTKKRKLLNLPLSCIDTKGTAVTCNDYLSRYEMLLYMDPLADSVTPWQKKDFEMAFRMIKPSDIFTPVEDNDDESTDYTNSDTD